MLSEVCVLAESLWAHIRAVRFLSSVSTLMFSQVRALGKASVTVTAFIGLLSRMNLLMLSQMGLLAKGFFTFVTLVVFSLCEFFDVEQEMNSVERSCHTWDRHTALLLYEFSCVV